VTAAAPSGRGAGAVVTAVVVLPPEQVPLLHVRPEPQTFPHLPQLPASACRFRQTPLQGVCPPEHEEPLTVVAVVRPPAGTAVVIPVTGTCRVPAVQMPLLQYWEALHALPHRPQLLESTRVLRHAPPQMVWPSTQLPPGPAADGDGKIVVRTSVISAGGVLLVFGGKVHPLASTRQMTVHRMRHGAV
jgi:hypothetical protein